MSTRSEQVDALVVQFFSRLENIANHHNRLGDDHDTDAAFRRVWDLLTALRGPDDGSMTIKLKYTEPLRALLCPRTCNIVGAFGTKAKDGTEIAWEDSIRGQEHFMYHAMRGLAAASGLGYPVRRLDNEVQGMPDDTLVDRDTSFILYPDAG